MAPLRISPSKADLPGALEVDGTAAGGGGGGGAGPGGGGGGGPGAGGGGMAPEADVEGLEGCSCMAMPLDTVGFDFFLNRQEKIYILHSIKYLKVILSSL